MIAIRNLTKQFKNNNITALDDVSCDIESNKIVGLIGPDGAGKTTLLRIVAGILTPNNGDVFINGKCIDLYNDNHDDRIPIKKLHEIISYMPQKFGLYEDLSIMENLTLYAQLHNLREDEKQSAFEKVLKITKLEKFRNRLAGNLSGGMKQKLGLACSLLKKPNILILDEPSVGVDPVSRRDLISMVGTMIDENTTVLWSTAYLDEAQNLDHVILLNEGKVIFEGSPNAAIQNVRGRVFLFAGLDKSKRCISSELLKREDVVDSGINGQFVKILIVKNADVKSVYDSINCDDVAPPIRIEPAFEDACVDILGGVSTKESKVGEYVSDVLFSGDENVVDAENLTKRFADFTAVDNISFSLGSGKILGLLGPNGSGKSTTFKMLCGLLEPDGGVAKIAGVDISQMGSDAKMNIGYMAQKFSLYSILSVRQNLEFFSGVYRLKGKNKKKAIDSMIEIFNLQHFQNVNAGTLSLGFKQRLALACAIMHKPRVLFLDEPTSGVDPLTRKEFLMHINAMVTRGISVIITTHFMDEAEFCDDVALIFNGKIRALGTPDQLKEACSVENATLEHAFIEITKVASENDARLT
ncbi:MAG: ATP-binding cassette domain-containing protein [Holosporales bacterium]|jgi:ABC-2 type transport system ATP-binding protein|nr:ATP-binding cassette domain-containing protein [Holosporales bacterium]